MALPHHDVAIVGSGFAGLGMAIELTRAGRRDFVVLEKADRLRGTGLRRIDDDEFRFDAPRAPVPAAVPATATAEA